MNNQGKKKNSAKQKNGTKDGRQKRISGRRHERRKRIMKAGIIKTETTRNS